MTTRTPRVAVIGAGPGGLACARALQRAGVDVTVHERDASRSARDQGGTLDVQVGTGQVALRALGLFDGFLAIARPEGQDMRALDKHGTVLRERICEPGDTEAPEIDRAELRDLLLDSLAPGTVAWGRAFDSATPLGGGRHRLAFADGSTTEVDLLVGADGAWSRVRPLVSGARPSYEGVVFVEVRLRDVDAHHPEVAALVGRGSMFAMQDNLALIAQRQSGGRVRVYAAFRDGLGWARRCGVDLDDPAAARAHLLDRFDGWSPELRRLLVECDDLFLERPVFALPVPHLWNTRAGVTLVGDAAHLMSPFSGLGANTALLDGVELAQAVLREPDLLTAVAEYERVMLPRAARNAAGAHEGLHSAISDGAPDDVEFDATA
ncbi:FAD-dependent oxidoreductase [Actinokineospora bangkokensis]|uniref:Flavin-dependent monooxygenase n=1 Tax=Actinokineospora bangkokensis TaxID=1193682 RepID=A0A1Q9LM31_9PSEU|nr:NAD(P)/FAD-dependent oxidoreductase [Actinokineospora bangkokensis]OLR93080.1 FAD-dependent oxidoreductase [Actinokineospora bangkokensis]